MLADTLHKLLGASRKAVNLHFKSVEPAWPPHHSHRNAIQKVIALSEHQRNTKNNVFSADL